MVDGKYFQRINLDEVEHLRRSFVAKLFNGKSHQVFTQKRFNIDLCVLNKPLSFEYKC